MIKRKIKIDYSGLTDTELDQKADEVLLGMTGNASYPDPVAALADVTTASNEYRAALTAAATGAKVAIGIKDQKRAALLALLRRLAQYAQLTANDDEAIMQSSGFELTKLPSTHVLLKPQNFHAVAEGKGMIAVSLKKVDGARTYQYEYRKVGDENWKPVLYSKSRLLITDLQSGAEYEFRVLPVGTSTVREYSEAVRSFVL